MFETIEAGQRFTVRDMSGETLIRERGQLRFTYLFDTEGNDRPGGHPRWGTISPSRSPAPTPLRDDRRGVVRAAWTT